MPDPSNAADRPLRVLQVISGDLWAGAESQFFQLVAALHDRPEVDVRAAVMNPGILADRLIAKGVRVDVFVEREQPTVQVGHGLCAIAREWRPDVIHTHRRKEHILGGLAAIASGAKAVATIHGQNEFTHPWWQPRQALLASLEHIVLTRIHCRLIAVSTDMAAHLPGKRDNIVVIPNGIDIPSVRKAGQEAMGTLPGCKGGRLAFVGRLEPVKRVDRIVGVLAALHSMDPGRWDLFIIGDGTQRPQIEALVQEQSLSPYVHMVGFSDNPLPLLAQMDALIFASEHEGLPMSALEALALGVPVISPALGGLSDLIRQAETGCISSSAEPAVLADAVRSSTNGNRQGQSALPPQYTIEHSCHRHIQLYRSSGKHETNV
jgi:L-malate glycosyltransferase